MTGMPNMPRPHRVNARLSDEEMWFCDELSKRHGLDHSGVMRMYMLKGAREEGLVYPEPPQSVVKKKTPRKRSSG
jgi:hypothetical protein